MCSFCFKKQRQLEIAQQKAELVNEDPDSEKKQEVEIIQPKAEIVGTVISCDVPGRTTQTPSRKRNHPKRKQPESDNTPAPSKQRPYPLIRERTTYSDAEKKLIRKFWALVVKKGYVVSSADVQVIFNSLNEKTFIIFDCRFYSTINGSTCRVLVSRANWQRIGLTIVVSFVSTKISAALIVISSNAISNINSRRRSEAQPAYDRRALKQKIENKWKNKMFNAY